jgi:hypothetical protein
MAVISTIAYQVEQGREADFLATVKEARAVIEPLAVNLKSIRLRRAAIAGQDSGIYRVAFEYEDLASWAQTVSREEKDPGFNALARKGAASGVATIVDRALLTQIAPPAASGAPRGNVTQVAAGRVKPGRMDDFIRQTADVNQFLLRSGALNTRHFSVIVGGAQTGTVITLSEYADMAAFGNAWKRNDDPEWRALVEAIAGPDGPVTVAFQALVTEVEL